MKYKLLGKRRFKIRDIARQAYLDNKDPQKAIDQATKEIRTGSIVITILVGLAIKLAIELIWYWFNNKVSSPSMFYLPEEPGN